MNFKLPKFKLIAVMCIAAAVFVYINVVRVQNETRYLKKIIERLTADSRVAEVIVTDVRRDSKAGKTYTTIQFTEYDTGLTPLEPRHFTFSGNIIQFQSLVIRFDDFYVKKGHSLKGKSAYLFMKAFMLTSSGAEIFDITTINEIPSGYEIKDIEPGFQKKLWNQFWEYALDPQKSGTMGIKSAQIEAPGTKFIPNVLYTIKIEHDGGLRIDAKPIAKVKKS